MQRYVIVGGGPCGLAAGWELAKRGLRPLVIERETLVGGLCATHAMTTDRGTWRFDLGGHRFVSADAELARLVESLLGDDLLVQERKSVVLHEGRAFKYPLDAVDLIRTLGIRENGHALFGFLLEQLKQMASPKKDVSFQDWVTARFGVPLYETFFGPYTEKLWGLDPATISADWAAERISLLHLGDAALRLAGLRRTAIRTYAKKYRYPRFGMGQLFEVLAREIVRLGGEVRTGATLSSIETEGERVLAINVHSASGGERILVRELLSTLSLPDLVRELHLDSSSTVARATRSLRFRSLTFLNLLLGRPDVSDNTWMYVASGRLRISRIQEPKRRSLEMAPHGLTSMMLEVPCTVGDGICNADTPLLRQMLEPELRELGLHKDDIVGAFRVRVEHGYPIYHLDYERDRRTLLASVEQFRNVRTAGRQGLFRYVFLDAAMQMGIESAIQMTEGERNFGRLDALGRSTSVIEARALTA